MPDTLRSHLACWVVPVQASPEEVERFAHDPHSLRQRCLDAEPETTLIKLITTSEDAETFACGLSANQDDHPPSSATLLTNALQQFGFLNESAMARSWINERRVFSVLDESGPKFPDFQFVNGKPRSHMAKILKPFGPETTGETLCLWFTAPSPYLDGERPLDLLESNPSRVVSAAEREAEALVF